MHSLLVKLLVDTTNDIIQLGHLKGIVPALIVATE